jgi:antirestriction protein
MNTLDTRDLIERYEELEEQEERSEEEETEFSDLAALLDELEGNGGDEQWRGEWYPTLLIDEADFTDYAQELCEECGDISSDLPWYIANHIDWEGVAREIRCDYSSVEFDGTTYYYR